MTNYILTILLSFAFQFSYSQSFLKVCDASDLYKDLEKELSKDRGFKINDSDDIILCLSVSSSDSSILSYPLKPGLYKFREMQIHSSQHLIFAQLQGERRVFLNNYNFKNYVDFVKKHTLLLQSDQTKQFTTLSYFINLWLDERKN